MKSAAYAKCVDSDATPRTIDTTGTREALEVHLPPTESQFSRNKRNEKACFISAFGSHRFEEEENSEMNLFLDTEEKEGVSGEKKNSFHYKRNSP